MLLSICWEKNTVLQVNDVDNICLPALQLLYLLYSSLSLTTCFGLYWHPHAIPTLEQLMRQLPHTQRIR
jgi:hypothetical protein